MQFDYDNVRTRLVDGLKSRASWSEILFFSTNSRLIDSVSEAISEYASYDEFLTRNTKWDLATDKSALVSQAQFMQYEPHRKIGASGTIRVSTSETFNASYDDIGGTDSIVFPKYTVFADEGGSIKFTSTSTQVLAITDDYIDIDVIQGEPKIFTYNADGDNYEEISIENSNIENALYEITVNGTAWEQISDLNAADKDDKVYKLENKLNFDGINIIYGNDIFGVKLQSGDTVTFKHLETLGITGNILGSGTINTVESTIYDSNISPNTVDMFCTNLSNLDGGDDEEDIEDIRTKGTNTFQAGDKAVAQKDYKVKLEQSPYIFKSTVWGAYEYNLDNNVDLWTYIPTEENFVRVSAFTPLGEQLDTSQKNEVLASIKEDKPPTDIVSFVDADFIYLAFHIEAFVEDTAKVLSVVKTEIIDGVTDRYSLKELEFKQPIYEVDWKGYVKSIDGVTYHTSYLDLISYSTLNSNYVGDINLDIFTIEKESMKIYIRDTTAVENPFILLGTDNGDGNLVGDGDYDLTGSLINYTTGEGALIIVSGISGNFTDYELKTYYATDSVNIELKTRNQIFKVAEIEDVIIEYTIGN